MSAPEPSQRSQGGSARGLSLRTSCPVWHSVGAEEMLVPPAEAVGNGIAPLGAASYRDLLLLNRNVVRLMPIERAFERDVGAMNFKRHRSICQRACSSQLRSHRSSSAAPEHDCTRPAFPSPAIWLPEHGRSRSRAARRRNAFVGHLPEKPVSTSLLHDYSDDSRTCTHVVMRGEHRCLDAVTRWSCP